MLNLTGIHNSQTCTLGTNGQPCDACCWAQDVQEQREYAEWLLYAEMNNFAARYGPEALKQQISQYVRTLP